MLRQLIDYDELGVFNMDFKKGLMLRQQVPVDAERITFNELEEIDDMWIWLFREIHKKLNLSHSEVWMWGGKREVYYEDDFIERWYDQYPTDIYYPDLIFSRGGFKEYIPVMKSNPDAYKIYYGAIYKDRLNPSTVGDETKYDMILADSYEQFNDLKDDGYEPIKFLKPACENIFKPFDISKKYDVVFIANAKQKKIKGHEWFFNQMKDTGWRILQIGNTDKKLVKLAKKLKLDIKFTGWVPRKDIPLLACTAKVGVCCSVGDSCPRVIPEMLAMGLPIVVKRSDKLFIWGDYFKYKGSKDVYNEVQFNETIKLFLNDYKSLNSFGFYVNKFSIDSTAEGIVDKILKDHRRKV